MARDTLDDDLLADMVRELRELEARSPVVHVAITPTDAWYLIALLQLALRHPGIEGHVREAGARVKAALFARVASTPALATVARMGDDPALDS